MYAIMRSLKLKSDTDISASDNHCQRLNKDNHIDPGNIDQNLTPFNWSMNRKSLHDNYQEAVQAYDIHQPRKDSVKVVEFMMSLSPEYFDRANRKSGKNDPLIKEFLVATHEFLNRLPGTLLLNMHLHVDEPGAAPHIHAHVVILGQDKNGRTILNASRLLDGKKKMSELQDLYHMSIIRRIEGVQRGLPASITKRKHIPLKDIRKSLAKLTDMGVGPDQINRITTNLIAAVKYTNSIKSDQDIEHIIKNEIEKIEIEKKLENKGKSNGLGFEW